MSAGNDVPGESQTSDQLHYPSIYCRQVPGAISVGAVSEPWQEGQLLVLRQERADLVRAGRRGGRPRGGPLCRALSGRSRLHLWHLVLGRPRLRRCRADALGQSCSDRGTGRGDPARVGPRVGPEEPRQPRWAPARHIAEAVTRGKPGGRPGAWPAARGAREAAGRSRGRRATARAGIPGQHQHRRAGRVAGGALDVEGRATIIVADRADAGPYASLWDLRRTGAFTTFIINFGSRRAS